MAGHGAPQAEKSVLQNCPANVELFRLIVSAELSPGSRRSFNLSILQLTRGLQAERKRANPFGKDNQTANSPNRIKAQRNWRVAKRRDRQMFPKKKYPARRERCRRCQDSLTSRATPGAAKRLPAPSQGRPKPPFLPRRNQRLIPSASSPCRTLLSIPDPLRFQRVPNSRFGCVLRRRISPIRSIAAGSADAATWRACARVCDLNELRIG